LQYLNGTNQEPQIHHGSSYDLIASGGVDRFGNELLSNHRFKELLNKLCREYDWVIAFSTASIKTAQAVSMLKLFPISAITLSGETLQEIETFSSKRTTFIFKT